MRTLHRLTRAAAVAVCATAVLAPAASAEEPALSRNLEHLKNLSYEPRNGGTPNYGTDIEFARIKGRDYAFAGSYRNGLQIIDISSPKKPFIAAVYDCGITQGDVQVFQQKDMKGRWFATYTSDTFGDGTSTCYQDARKLGFDVNKANGTGRNGTFIVEISTPQKPRTASFVEFPQGSHNMTVHPSGNWLYNSNSDLITSTSPAIEYTDISNPFKPGETKELALPPRPGLGTESHDITFNEDGSRGYSAALSQGVIIDTTDPGDPKMITSFLNPAINVWHQADPFTLIDGSGRKREFLVVEDEFAGAVGTGQCPNGGVWFYEVTGELERNPALVGYYNLDEARKTDQVDGRCTAHVFDIHEDAKVLTIAWYNGGVRVLDLSGLEGVTIGGNQITGAAPVKEIAAARFTGSDTWAAKAQRINDPRKPFHLFANDVARGFDAFKYTPPASFKGAKRRAKGRWMSGGEALAALSKVAPPKAGYRPFCLLPS